MYLEEYKRWMAADLEDADLNPELRAIEGNETEIKERFAVALKFGIAGLRVHWIMRLSFSMKHKIQLRRR